MHRVLHRLPALVDVLLPATAEGGDRGALHDGGDLLHRFEFSLARGGEPRLYDVHTEGFQSLGDVEFLVDVHTAPRRLLAVAQRGVKNLYSSLRVFAHMFRCFPVVFSYIFPLDFPLFLRLLSCPLLVVFRVLTMSSAAVRGALTVSRAPSRGAFRLVPLIPQAEMLPLCGGSSCRDAGKV